MTRASDTRPTIRELTTRFGDRYVVTLGASVVSLRPKGTRSPKVRIDLDVGALYIRALTAQIEADRKARRRGKAGGRK